MDLNTLEKLKNRLKTKKRLGRGIGSGKGGHTVGRGAKGQKARKGNGKPWLGFEGGQVPLYKRFPRVNTFKSKHRVKVLNINLDLLNIFDDGTLLTPEHLLKTKAIPYLPSSGIKILSDGQLKKKLSLKGFRFSETALKKIGKSGSEIVK